MSRLQRRHSRLTPVGDILVSYEASEMPISVLEGFASEVLGEHERGERSTLDTLLVFGWLFKIAVQKLRAVET